MAVSTQNIKTTMKEPKFHIGDTVRMYPDDIPYQIIDVIELQYTFKYKMIDPEGNIHVDVYENMIEYFTK